jgi:hypothetical protein
MSQIDKLNQDKNIILSLPEKTFADMIVNFLGKKESIKYKKNTYFNVSITDLTQFYYLLDAKIKKEQYTHINAFSITINYNDSTSRELNTIGRLETFHETRNIIPSSIIMTWNIVLKFPDSATVENQNINIHYSITDETIDGSISLNIQHTNPAWGLEVLNLFLDNIHRTIISENKNISLINNFSEHRALKFIKFLLMSLLIITLSIVPLALMGESDRYKYSNEKYELVADIYTLSDKGTISTKEFYSAINVVNKFTDRQLELYRDKNENIGKSIDKYLNKNKGKTSRKIKIASGIVLTILFILFFSKYYIVSYVNYYRDKSFINITDAANKSMNKFKESKNKTVFYGLSLFIFSIVCSIIGSIIVAIF